MTILTGNCQSFHHISNQKIWWNFWKEYNGPKTTKPEIKFRKSAIWKNINAFGCQLCRKNLFHNKKRRHKDFNQHRHFHLRDMTRLFVTQKNTWKKDDEIENKLWTLNSFFPFFQYCFLFCAIYKTSKETSSQVGAFFHPLFANWARIN